MQPGLRIVLATILLLLILSIGHIHAAFAHEAFIMTDRIGRNQGIGDRHQRTDCRLQTEFSGMFCNLPERSHPATHLQHPVAAQPRSDTPTPPGLVTRTPRPSSTPTGTPTPTAIPTATATATPPRRSRPLPLRQRFRAQPDDIVTEINPGIFHIRRVTSDPLRINVLLFDITSPQFDVRTGLGDNWLSGRTRPSYMARQNGAIAAVNGDLFSHDGIPQGLTMIDSQVAMAPKHRATFAWSRDRKPFIGYFTENWSWDAHVIAPNGAQHSLLQLNWPCPENAICLYNHFARSAPARVGDVKVLVNPVGRVRRIVQEQPLRIAKGMWVLQGTGTSARWLLENMELDDRVQINLQTDPPLSDYTQAISGGPLIVRDGKFVQDCFCTLRDCSATDEEDLLCEDFDLAWKESHYLWVQMPRTGIGFDAQQQTLIVAVVDGYQLGYSRGMRQEEFADLFIEFGATTAMELDGGGSVTMVLEDQIVNRPSDDTGERFVANALLFLWREHPSSLEFVPMHPAPGTGLRPR